MRYWLVIIFMFVSVIVCAQPGPPGNPDDVPLGGIEILIAAGALFGAKKALDKKKSK